MRNIKTRILEAVTFTAAAKVVYGVVKGTLLPVAWENFIIGKCIPAAGLSFREADVLSSRIEGVKPKGLFGTGVYSGKCYYVGNRIFRPFVKDGIKGVIVTTLTPTPEDKDSDADQLPTRVCAVASENIAYFFTRDYDAVARIVAGISNTIQSYVNMNNSISAVTSGADSNMRGAKWETSYRNSSSMVDLLDLPLPTGVCERIMHHVNRMRDEWDDADSTYRRCVVLYGPRGTGKSTIPEGVAATMVRPLYSFTNAIPQMAFWDDLVRLMASRKSISVFDEADKSSCFQKRTDEAIIGEGSGSNLMTQRDIYDFLSGPRAPATLTFVITNFPEKLSTASLRAGRCKDRIFVGHTDDAAIKRWIKHKFDVEVGDSHKFPDLTMAEIFSIYDDHPDVNDLIPALLVATSVEPKQKPYAPWEEANAQ